MDDGNEHGAEENDSAVIIPRAGGRSGNPSRKWRENEKQSAFKTAGTRLALF